MKERFGQIAASYVLLKKGNKYLLTRRYNTGYHDGEYSTLAGHVEKDETARESAVREALEEGGVKVKMKDLKLAHILHRPSDMDIGVRRIDFFFVADKWQGEPKIMEPHKCDEFSWHALDKIPQNTIHYIKHVLKCIKNKEIYSEFGWDKWAK